MRFHGADKVIDRCVRLVIAARNLGIPITMSEQYPQGLGPTHDSVRDAFANDGFVADKTEFSCMRNEMLRDRLHALRRDGRSQVVIGGDGGTCLRDSDGLGYRVSGLRGLRGRRRRGVAHQEQVASSPFRASRNPMSTSWTRRWCCLSGWNAPEPLSSRPCTPSSSRVGHCPLLQSVFQ